MPATGSCSSPWPPSNQVPVVRRVIIQELSMCFGCRKPRVPSRSFPIKGTLRSKAWADYIATMEVSPMDPWPQFDLRCASLFSPHAQRCSAHGEACAHTFPKTTAARHSVKSTTTTAPTRSRRQWGLFYSYSGMHLIPDPRTMKLVRTTFYSATAFVKPISALKTSDGLSRQECTKKVFE